MENMPETSTYVPNITREDMMGGSTGGPPSGRGLQRGGGGRGPPPDGGSGGRGGSSSGGSGGGGMSRSEDPNATASGVYLTGAWLFNALDGNNLDAVE